MKDPEKVLLLRLEDDPIPEKKWKFPKKFLIFSILPLLLVLTLSLSLMPKESHQKTELTDFNSTKDANDIIAGSLGGVGGFCLVYASITSYETYRINQKIRDNENQLISLESQSEQSLKLLEQLKNTVNFIKYSELPKVSRDAIFDQLTNAAATQVKIMESRGAIVVGETLLGIKYTLEALFQEMRPSLGQKRIKK